MIGGMLGLVDGEGEGVEVEVVEEMMAGVGPEDVGEVVGGERGPLILTHMSLVM